MITIWMMMMNKEKKRLDKSKTQETEKKNSFSR